jgi:hypothetical protein
VGTRARASSPWRGLLGKLRGNGIAIADSVADAEPTTWAPLAGYRGAADFIELAVDTPRPAGLDRAYHRESPALLLLYSYMTRGTTVKKCAWSCRLSRSRDRLRQSVRLSATNLAAAGGNHTSGLPHIRNLQQAVSRAMGLFTRDSKRRGSRQGPLTAR